MRVERLFATIGASFEDFVAQVENHEAVAQSVIDDVRSNAARVRMQLKSLEKTRSLLTESMHKISASAVCWRARAKGLADTDRPKALECLRRAKDLDLELDEVTERERWHQRSLTQLRSDANALERKLRELELRRASLVSRHARARAEREFGGGRSYTSAGDSIFDRWETEVVRDEYSGGGASGYSDRTPDDPLAEDFTAQELLRALNAELDAMRDAVTGR